MCASLALVAHVPPCKETINSQETLECYAAHGHVCRSYLVSSVRPALNTLDPTRPTVDKHPCLCWQAVSCLLWIHLTQHGPLSTPIPVLAGCVRPGLNTHDATRPTVDRHPCLYWQAVSCLFWIHVTQHGPLLTGTLVHMPVLAGKHLHPLSSLIVSCCS